MIFDNLKNFIKGWFIGNFKPTLFKTTNFEIAIKRYKKGDYEKPHYHKISTEYTIIISGTVEMNGIKHVKNEIIIISPNEKTDFRCLSSVITCVVKIPSSENDKYIL